MTLPSAWRYRAVRLRGEHPKKDNLVRLKMKRPCKAQCTLREGSADFEIWREIWFDQVYVCALQYVPGCKTIIDLGANIGLATLYFASAYPKARIVSVEAEASNFAMLRRNVEKLVRQKRCQPIHAAAWSHEGSVVLSSYEHGDHARYQFAEDYDGPQKVESVSMPTILQRSGFTQVDLLKIDIEGAEVQLFQGDFSWLNRVNAIAIEFHWNSRSDLRFDEIMKGWNVIEASRHTVLAMRA